MHVQCAILAADVAPLMVPCDVTDFLSHHSEIQSDLALCIIVALMKEPTATRLLVEQWRHLPTQYDAADMQHALQFVVRACASTPGVEATLHTREQEQLTRQGVARFSGLAPAAKDLGVVRKVDEGDAEETDYITLGLTHVKYAFTKNPSTMHKFLSRVRAAAPSMPPPCFDAGALQRSPEESAAAFNAVLEYGSKVRTLMAELGTNIRMCPKIGSGYKVDTVVRKLCIPFHEGMPWHLVPGQASGYLRRRERELGVLSGEVDSSADFILCVRTPGLAVSGICLHVCVEGVRRFES